MKDYIEEILNKEFHWNWRKILPFWIGFYIFLGVCTWLSIKMVSIPEIIINPPMFILMTILNVKLIVEVIQTKRNK